MIKIVAFYLGANPAIRFIPDKQKLRLKPCFSISGDAASIRARAIV
jgi:hypothetical protein